MSDSVPSTWRDVVSWQRLVAGPLNKISQGYPYPLWDAEPADTNEGYAFYDTQDQAPKWYDGTNYKTFASLDDIPPPPTLEWTQIATSTPTGVSTVTFSSIPNTYSDLMVAVQGVSHNNASDRYLTVAVSANGSSFTSGIITNDIGAGSSAVLYGKVFIPGYGTTGGLVIAATAALGSSPGSYPTGEFIRTVTPVRLTGGVSAIRFGWNGAGNFDAGTLTLYGR